MNHTESNPCRLKPDQIQLAGSQFKESEWRLEFLRTLSSQPLPKPAEDELCKIFTQNQSSASLN
jgi:hypothetical protein